MGHFLNGGIKDVADLRVRRREVALVNLRELPHPFADATTTHPRFTRTETGNVGFELVLHR
ncbi:hypothetical protein D3C80_2145960 [compost metagenome]